MFGQLRRFLFERQQSRSGADNSPFLNVDIDGIELVFSLAEVARSNCVRAGWSCSCSCHCTGSEVTNRLFLSVRSLRRSRRAASTCRRCPCSTSCNTFKRSRSVAQFDPLLFHQASRPLEKRAFLLCTNRILILRLQRQDRARHTDRNM